MSTHPLPGWLFVLPWSLQGIGGVNEVVKALITQFRDGKAFFPYLLVTSEEPSSDCADAPEVIRPYRLNIWTPVDQRHPVRAFISFLYRFPNRCWTLLRIIQQHKVRVINPHFPELGCLVFLALKRLRLFDGKIILSFHLSDIQTALSTTGAERKLWRMLLRGADQIVVVSDHLSKDVLAVESTVAGKITTIYNGVDLVGFTPYEPREQLFKPSQNRTILSIGAFIARKGHDVLVRAFELVLRKVPDVRLILVGGNGPEAESIRALIDSMSLADKIFIFKDIPHERIPSFLAKADLFVLASRREGYPLAVIEAGAARVPVVCTHTSGCGELISDKMTGRLVEIDNEHALADAMIDLLTHPEEAKKLAFNFNEHIQNHLTWQHTYRKYLEIVGCK